MRSGYTDDIDNRDLAMWRGRVASAIRGRRGQQLLKDLLAALDAMPEKCLVRMDLVNADGVCALGAVGKARGVADIDTIDPEDHHVLGERLNVAECLIQEIEFTNDDDFAYQQETPEQRFVRVRKWVQENIRP